MRDGREQRVGDGRIGAALFEDRASANLSAAGRSKIKC